MYKHSAHALHQLFKDGELSAKNIAEISLKRIAHFDPKIGSFLSVLSERVMKKAKALDEKRKEKRPLGKLAGVTIAIKDNIHIKGELSTCASRFLSNYRAVFDATVVKLLEEEDALLIGKTNMDEFAMGSSNENSAFHLTRNPWDLNCSPGGSSGGSAACVAARFCPLSLGSDTGGSIRQPASFTGIVGYKPTYGRVSRNGLVAFASSLDQIGPFATNVKDVALIMDVMGRYCPRDATSLPSPHHSFSQELEGPIKGMKIGVPWNFLEDLHAETKDNFMKSIEVLKSLGVEIETVDLDVLDSSIAVYYILATAEASTNLARFDGIRYGNRSPDATTIEEVYELSRTQGFGPEVKKRILLGTFVLSSGFQDAYYKKAQKVRTLIIQKLKAAFSKCQLIAMPTSPIPAFEIGGIKDPVQMYLQDIYTIGANLAGLPAISVPSGFNKQNKPFGLQLLGPTLKDLEVLRVAHFFEQAGNWGSRIPPLFDKEV